jgi:hypothetical protein
VTQTSQSATTATPAGSATPQLRGWLRALLAVVGVGLTGLLVTAGSLTPSERGLGTHQQLGLPPCTFETLFGARCPSCGMTTSWAHAMRGQLPSAVRSNVGGTLLAGIALLAGPWTLASAVRGRWLWGVPSDMTLAAIAITIILVTLVDWCVRITTG